MLTNQSGSLHLVAVLGVLVATVVGFAGYKTMQSSSASSTNTVTVTAPQSGASVSKAQIITAFVGGKRDIKSIDFKVNGNAAKITDLAKCYPNQPLPKLLPRNHRVCWDTTSVADGSHDLTAAVTFKSGADNKITSAPVKVTVNNQSALTVSIVNPADASTYRAGAYVAVAARASVNATFALQGNGTAITGAGMDKCYPGGPLPAPQPPNAALFCLNTSDFASSSSIRLTATATANGQTATSAPVTIKKLVDGTPPPPPLTVTITSPKDGAIVPASGYLTLYAQASTTASISFTGNGTAIQPSPMTNCTGPGVAVAPPPPNAQLICFNAGSYGNVTKISLVATATANGLTATSNPVLLNKPIVMQ